MITVQCDKCKGVTIITSDNSIELSTVLSKWGDKEHYLCTICDKEWNEFINKIDDEFITYRKKKVVEFFS